MYLGCQGSRANGFAAGGTQLSSHPVPTKDRPCPELPTVTVPPRAQNTAGDGSRSFPSLVGETEAVCRLEALLLGLQGSVSALRPPGADASASRSKVTLTLKGPMSEFFFL